MNFKQFMLTLTQNERGLLANSTDGNVKLFWMQAIGLNLVDTTDPVTTAALNIIYTPDRVAALVAADVPLFSLTQLLALFTAAEISALMLSSDVKIKTFLFQNAGHTFTLPQIKTALDYLVAQNILTAAREATIFASTPS